MHRAIIHAFAAAALLCATPAPADTVNQRAEKQARGYLIPCDEDGNDQARCERNQSVFIHNFVRARSTDVPGMIYVANSFSIYHTPENKLIALGLPFDQIEACAWRLVAYVRLPIVETRELARRDLFRLIDEDKPHCKERAEAIDREIHAHPARRPADNWFPAATKIKPADRIDRHCLIATVPDDAGEMPPLPADCPR